MSFTEFNKINTLIMLAKMPIQGLKKLNVLTNAIISDAITVKTIIARRITLFIWLDIQNKYSILRERENREAIQRGEDALGGRTLSEALRTRAALRSTRVRRQIKAAYNKAKNEGNLTGTNDSFTDEGVDSSVSEGASDVNSSSGRTEQFTVIINGQAEQRDFLMG